MCAAAKTRDPATAAMARAQGIRSARAFRKPANMRLRKESSSPRGISVKIDSTRIRRTHGFSVGARTAETALCISASRWNKWQKRLSIQPLNCAKTGPSRRPTRKKEKKVRRGDFELSGHARMRMSEAIGARNTDLATESARTDGRRAVNSTLKNVGAGVSEAACCCRQETDERSK